jgi:hypothetical protein
MCEVAITGGCHATGCAVLGLVRLTGTTRIHSLKRKDQAGHVEYWKAVCGESRMHGVDGGKERKLLPIRTKGLAIVPRQRPTS